LHYPLEPWYIIKRCVSDTAKQHSKTTQQINRSHRKKLKKVIDL